MKHRIAIFASGGGSNAAKIMEYFQQNENAKVSLVLTNKDGAGVIDKAGEFQVPCEVFNREELQNGSVRKRLLDAGIGVVVLAGFLWKMPEDIVAAYRGQILNIHPALLPKYGGKGMYGMNVHQAVKDAGEAYTGMTIHLVDEKYDNGAKLFQARVKVASDDTPEMIAEKVLALEHKFYPRLIEAVCKQL